MKTLSFLMVIAAFIVAAGFTRVQSDPWVVPEKAAKTPNPVKADAESLSAGKALWSLHCESCHGKTGLGDGKKAAQLKTQPADFTKAEFQSQTDGSIFYKISEGRKDMPSFKKKIPDQEDIWNLVNYMRKFKK
ncbi:MAG: cytochrome c [Bacteroidetes bacterium]|nr:cytochrome c [Bacteroidota bacterium]